MAYAPACLERAEAELCVTLMPPWPSSTTSSSGSSRGSAGGVGGAEEEGGEGPRGARAGSGSGSNGLSQFAEPLVWRFPVQGNPEMPRAGGVGATSIASYATGGGPSRASTAPDGSVATGGLSKPGTAGTMGAGAGPGAAGSAAAAGPLGRMGSGMPSGAAPYRQGSTASAGAAEITTFKFKCKARSRLEEVVEVLLTGLAAVPPEGEVFSHEVVMPPGAPEELSSPGVFSVVPVREPRITAPGQPLTYLVSFAPPKVMSESVELVVSKASGGRWRFELQLVATEPDADGVITLEAAIDSTVTVPLPLFSSSDEPQPFTAWLSGDTPLTFTVQPSKGLLPVMGAEGADSYGSPTAAAGEARSLSPSGRPLGSAPQRRVRTGSGAEDGAAAGGQQQAAALSVSYTCRDFGKVLKGRLFVQTPDTLYTYDLRGKMPEYRPPKPSDFVPSVDNKLTPEMQARLALAASPSRTAGRPNYVALNAKATKRPAGF